VQLRRRRIELMPVDSSPPLQITPGLDHRSGTLGQLMTGPTARHNAFDSLRLFAALAVICSHSFLINFGNYDHEPIHWLSSGQTILGSLAVGVFFVISGVFISASFDRSPSFADFTAKRVLRIMPGMVAVTAVTALVLGPALSTWHPAAYFANAEPWLYFQNIALFPMALHLPGVFEGNPITTVNESIWTLKFEVICYGLAAVSLALGRYRAGIVTMGWIASFLVVRFWPDADHAAGAAYYVVGTSRMFRYFGAGMVMYLYRGRLPIDGRLAWLCLGGCIAALATPLFVEVTAVLGAYAVIVFGYLAPAGFRNLTSRGDVSYGVYLYGWPIQQIAAPLAVGSPFGWLLNALIAAPLAIAMGTISWLLVERPVLRFKPGRKPKTA